MCAAMWSEHDAYKVHRDRHRELRDADAAWAGTSASTTRRRDRPIRSMCVGYDPAPRRADGRYVRRAGSRAPASLHERYGRLLKRGKPVWRLHYHMNGPSRTSADAHLSVPPGVSAAPVARSTAGLLRPPTRTFSVRSGRGWKGRRDGWRSYGVGNRCAYRLGRAAAIRCGPGVPADASPLPQTRVADGGVLAEGAQPRRPKRCR
jgi:hypothetical protein